jgi:hypothetical protein
LSAVPAAHFLVDFGGNEPAAIVAGEAPGEAMPAAADASHYGDQIEEAYSRGLQEGTAAAHAQLQAQLDEQQAAFEQSLATLRESWCSEQGALLSEQINVAVRDMEERITNSTGRILGPFLVAAVREQAIAELHATLQELLSANPEVALEISGPEDLLEAVRTSLSASVATVSFVANDTCDVRVKAGASVVETRMAAWLKHIEGAPP